MSIVYQVPDNLLKSNKGSLTCKPLHGNRARTSREARGMAE